jgi:YD repeat-containing protein
MNEAEKICDEIQRAMPKISPGTLRFWGVWFGRPYDSAHRIVASEHDRGVLRLRFNGDEQLTVWSPAGLTLDSSVFQINDAERVLWDWFYDGLPKVQSNRFFYDLVKTPESIIANSNVNWFEPNLKTDSTLPAAEILSIRINVKSP